MLSFVSGIGPRKAKKFLQNLKQLGRKVVTRGEIYVHKLLGPECHKSACSFLKIRMPSDEVNAKQQTFDVLDQTRIHPQQYNLAHKIACDIDDDA